MPSTAVSSGNEDQEAQTNSLTRRFPRVADLKRSDSLRSQSSSASESLKRVSFNNDVKVKRIPNKSKLASLPPQLPHHHHQQQHHQLQQFADFQKEEPPTDPQQVAQEAEKILRQLNLIECSVSTSAPTTLTSNPQGLPPPPPPPLPPPPPVLPSASGANSSRPTSDNEGSNQRRSRAGSLDSNSNPLYGLHALNNLDIAVNGKEVNSMPSYRDIRRRGLDGSGGSDDNSSTALDRYDTPSTTFDRFDTNTLPPPPKPPRKAPSTSPPSLRRSQAMMTHYARPATVSSPTSQLDQMMSSRKRFNDSNNDDSAIASGGDGGGTDDASGSNPSYRFPSHLRHRSSPPRLASPSRTCMTDTEILRSPTEVLYAVSDKRKIRGAENPNTRSVSASVQTMRSELRQNPAAGYFAKNPNRPSRNSSREDLLLTDDASYVSNGRRSASLQHQVEQQQQQRRGQSYNGFGQHTARSLERFLDGDDKENAFKTRIQVISPDRGQSPDQGRRKPYKTMINTATDNIVQYRIGSNENLRFTDYYTLRNEDGTEHYKVPKNKAPVAEDYYQQQQQQIIQQQRRRQMYRHAEDSDLSSTSYVPSQYRTAPGSRSQFTSTGLVKNADNRRQRPPSSSRELDREGRSIRREGRHYSGCSTSPDRDGSPERYARPIVNPNSGPYPYRSGVISASPDVSPTRPPRSRSSPVRELGRTISRTISGRREVVEELPRIRNGNATSLTREASMSRQPPVSRRRDRSNNEVGEDRLSRFTEYRGDDVDGGRRSSLEAVSDRERGRSLPPGATIESMRDFYKSSQFKSMYALPPSPNRPAPVLERSHSRRPTRVSISEGEVTDDAVGIPVARPEPVRPVRVGPRPSTKRPAPSPPGIITNSNVRRVVSSDRESVRTVPRESTRRMGPQPGGRRIVAGVGRRGSSVDGLDSSFSESEGINAEMDQQPRPWSSLSDDEEIEDEVGLILAAVDDDRPLSGISSQYNRAASIATTATLVHVHNREPVTLMIPPANNRVTRNVIFHDKPNSYNTIIKDKQPMGDFGRRWSAHQSDIDSDYRRELATSGAGLLHQEARTRDGGSSSILAASRMTGSSKSNIRSTIVDDHPDAIMRDEDEEEEQERFRDRQTATSAREEERRKVLEIEEERIRLEREAQLRRNGGIGPNGGLAGRTARTAHVHSAALRRGGHRQANGVAVQENEIQYGPGGAPLGTQKLNRYDQHRSASRVRRTASTVNNNNNNVNNPAAVGGVRREIVNQRKKLPGGSLTSSVNSSESERGSHAGQSAVSRATDASRRSVYLHAAAVVDIPSANERPSRALSADHTPAAPISNAASTSNLKNSKKISRSISLLAPWKPRNYKDKFEVIHYDNRTLYSNPPTTVTVGPGGTTTTSNAPTSGKPPRPPVPPVTRRVVPDKKSASSTDLLRDSQPMPSIQPQPAPTATPASAALLERRAQTLQRPQSKVSRSVSMPKDSRLAGWFKKRKRS